MDQQDWLARQFEEQRPGLRAVAYRILGSISEADDAVQDAWLRLSRTDTSEVDADAGRAAGLRPARDVRCRATGGPRPDRPVAAHPRRGEGRRPGADVV